MVRFVSLLLLSGFLFMGSVGFAAESLEPQSDSDISAPLDDLSDADFDADFEDDFESSGETAHELIADPLEYLNRGTFWFNDKLYFYVLKPVVKGYRWAVPRPARVSVKNVFSNLITPVRAVNSLLQLKFRSFGTEVYRFAINTTFGVCGLFDPAQSVSGVDPSIEDFGQTLGFYGVGHGFYLVLPLVGPSSLRDGFGSFADSYVDPLRYTGIRTYGLIIVRSVDSTTRLSLGRDVYDGIVKDSLDPYLFIRAAYAQRRLAQVGENVYSSNVFQGPLFDGDLLNPFEWFGLEL